MNFDHVKSLVGGVASIVRTAGLTLGGFTVVAVVGAIPAAEGQANFIGGGNAGFVVTDFSYALSDDANKTGACPGGMTQGYSNFGNVFLSRPDLQRGEEEKENDYLRRVFTEAISDPTTKNLCMNPEVGKPDPNFRTVEAPNVPAYGIDLDSQTSSTNGQPAPGTCAHDDFGGMNGETGIDNQFFRVVGCSKSFQSTGQSNTFVIEMHTGAWGILITLSGVDDINNDDSVEVGLYANADPIELSPTREPLANATYAIHPDSRFQATAKGRIVDGVVTTEPVDMRFYKVTNSIRLERPLRDARLRMTITADGSLEGYLAGYTPVEEMYDLQFGFRNGTDGTGQLAPVRRRAGSAGGAARVLGYTCNGVYYALHKHADGHPDPETGRCTSISTQYHFKAIPAFVIDDVETQSVNETLVKQ